MQLEFEISLKVKPFVLVKEAEDYLGRSFMHAPQYIGVNLREDHVPERCFIPKKHVHTYRGHNKGINCLQWFPKSAHLFLSSAMDGKVCKIIPIFTFTLVFTEPFSRSFICLF